MKERRIWPVVGGFLAGSTLFAALAYAALAWNNAVSITDVRAAASVVTRGNGRWLEVQYHLDARRRCPSWTQHALYHDTTLDHARRVVVPVGITINGFGEPASTPDFDINFPLDDSISPGTWRYIATTSSSCEWVPGLTRQQIQETEPIEVDIPKIPAMSGVVHR